VAIRGYDFATGTYDKGQAIQLGPGALSIDSTHLSEATHAWGHLNSPTERGIDIDIHGVHFGSRPESMQPDPNRLAPPVPRRRGGCIYGVGKCPGY
jgi:hypothetical protein